MPSSDSRRVTSGEILLPQSIELLSSIVLNPFAVAGATGHIALTHAIDDRTFEVLSGISTEELYRMFHSLLLVPQSDKPTQMVVFKGIFEGPDLKFDTYQVNATYRGSWDDGKIQITLTFTLSKKATGQTGLSITLEYTTKVSFLTRLSVVPIDEFFRNIVNKHLVPHFQLYIRSIKFPEQREKAGKDAPKLEPQALFSNIGKVNEVLPEALRTAKKAQYSVIVIKGDDLKGYMVLNQGRVTKAWFLTNEGSLEGDQAILQVMTLDSPVEVTVYIIDVAKALESWAVEFATRAAQLP
jgi:hypothetical protein